MAMSPPWTEWTSPCRRAPCWGCSDRTALAASRPGVRGRERDYELEQAKAEIARLCEACKELAVKLTLVEGKDGWG